MRIWERRKTMKDLLILAAVLILLTASVAMAASYPFTGVVTDDTNMRSSPNSYTSNVICRIPEGDEVYVLSASGNFYRIDMTARPAMSSRAM